MNKYELKAHPCQPISIKMAISPRLSFLMLSRKGGDPPFSPSPNPSRYGVSNRPLASGALSLLQPLPPLRAHSAEDWRNNKSRAPHRPPPPTDARIQHLQGVGGVGVERDYRGRTEKISFPCSPSFPRPSLPLGTLRHPQNPDLERGCLPTSQGNATHPPKAFLAPPPVSPYGVGERVTASLPSGSHPVGKNTAKVGCCKIATT